MKNWIKLIIKHSTEIPFFWKFWQLFIKFASLLSSSRNKYEKAIHNQRLESIFVTLEVLNGPFKGLVYPKAAAIGSAIYPKLLGSYEQELQGTIVEFSKNNYDNIMNIGCAEGYYIIGMAIKMTKSKCFAYDLDPKARLLCYEMAKLNNVSDRIKIGETISFAELKAFEFGNKGLILCDVEGSEIDLFNEQNIGHFANCDLIIEMHDFININISTELKALFNNTHEVKSIFSIDDIQKVHSYYYEVIAHLSKEEKLEVLRENRPIIMEWLVCKSRM
jgi:hypothetical protein